MLQPYQAVTSEELAALFKEPDAKLRAHVFSNECNCGNCKHRRCGEGILEAEFAQRNEIGAELSQIMATMPRHQFMGIVLSVYAADWHKLKADAPESESMAMLGGALNYLKEGTALAAAALYNDDNAPADEEAEASAPLSAFGALVKDAAQKFAPPGVEVVVHESGTPPEPPASFGQQRSDTPSGKAVLDN